METTSPHATGNTWGGWSTMTTRNANRQMISRRLMVPIAYAMVLIAFALGYILHP